MGVHAIDVAGLGGTNWTRIETARRTGPDDDAGGVAPHLQPLFAQSNFANRFRNDGSQRDALSDIPVWLSIDPDAGLRGAVAAADNPHMQSLVITDGD